MALQSARKESVLIQRNRREWRTGNMQKTETQVCSFLVIVLGTLLLVLQNLQPFFMHRWLGVDSWGRKTAELNGLVARVEWTNG